MTIILDNLILEKNTIFNEDLIIKGNIIGKNGKKYDLVVKGDLEAEDINVRNSYAKNYTCRDINALNLFGEDIDAQSIYAYNIYGGTLMLHQT